MVARRRRQAERRSEGLYAALGPKVAATVAGTVDGWRRALDIAAGLGGGLLLSDILADAIRLAENGTATPEHMAQSAASQWDAMKAGLDRRTGFVAGERPPRVGDRLVQPELARTLKRLADHGPRAFYEGDLARDIARDLRRVGSPLTLDDLRDYRADDVETLALRIGDAVLHVPPPPSQGVLSLMILATLRRVWQEAENETAKTHLLIEAIKQGLNWRAANLADPKTMRADWRKVLSDEAIGRPRFVVGKSPIPGDVARQILLEGRYSSEFVRELSRMGHDIALTKDFDSVMGHAGGILSTPDGVTEAAFDPRGDGAAAVDF